MTLYDNLYAKAAKASDHGQNVREIEPALLRALKQTADGDALEIGTNQGGSALLLMYHLMGTRRRLFTNDAAPVTLALPLLHDAAATLSVEWIHIKTYTNTFIDLLSPSVRFSFIYHDGSHVPSEVQEQVERLIPHLTDNAVVAIDDVHDFREIPRFKGLVDITKELDIDQRGVPSKHGIHIAVYQRET